MSNFNSITQTYLNKFSNTTKLINETINKACKQIIIIPSYCEPELEKTLNSLLDCTPPTFSTEIIIVLNCSAEDKETAIFHQKQKSKLEKSFTVNGNLAFRFIYADDLPPKHAGVGLARKIGMDEAIRRFEEIEYDGLLVCLDGDCTVNKNYLVELEKFAITPESYNTICLHFEHDLENEKDEILKKGIIYYELFLRYYKEALAYCKFLYAYHTIGSSMAVKASIYCKAGGMNKRKAGEDFYFLNKVFHYGKVVELNTAIVYPSARISTRVPFGTGRAQQNFIEKKDASFETYAFLSFEDLKTLFAFNFYEEDVDLNSFSQPVKQFLLENNVEDKVIEIKKNTTSKQQFQKRFFDWFDAFMLLKFVHFARDNYYANKAVGSEIMALLKRQQNSTQFVIEKDLLIYLRKIQIKLSNFN
ncbi:MAG: glycosyltransferase family 2 protein [Bacteroidia bacterium]|nr:glycosyltransferase family 2 protein [Bacteroidia bacterium]